MIEKEILADLEEQIKHAEYDLEIAISEYGKHSQEAEDCMEELISLDKEKHNLELYIADQQHSKEY